MWGNGQTQVNGLTVTPTGPVKGVETISVILLRKQGPEAYTSDAPQPRGLLCNPGSPQI